MGILLRDLKLDGLQCCAPCPVQICVHSGESSRSSGACAHEAFCLYSLQEKLQAVLKATYTHSRNLACFVFTYKSLCALQSHVQGETHQMHSFLAAFLGGLLVFGKNNNVNSQVRFSCDGTLRGGEVR